MKTSNQGYIEIQTPHSMFPVKVIPTYKTDGDKAEGIIITPGVGVARVWFTKEDIC